jgi:hypothetical protein
MNIVQLQYKLRDLPLSAVQAAANGRDPDIPEMLATMELNRRERMENAGAKPPTKSIKEQLEEKLSAQPQEQMGLPAMLQQAKQANGEPQQEQVQQPGQQMPPQGMPQQQPQQMSMGGVAGLPTSNMFKRFNSGGIVAFAEGDLVTNDDQSAAETARLKQAEAIAAARELLAMSGVNQQPQAAPVQRAPAQQTPALPADAQRANEIVKQMPFVEEAGKALEEVASGTATTPEQEMEKRQALLEKYGIRPPKEEELARIASSKEAYEKDRAARAEFQAQQGLAEAARPNVFGKYMPGTLGKIGSTFGLANLDADRAFREANDKAEVAAKETQRAFKMDNLSDAIGASRESEKQIREGKKAKATGLAQIAAHAMSAAGQITTNEESKRYHDMWYNIQDRELKQKIAKEGQDKIPEVMKNIEYIKKNFPSIASSMSPEQLVNYSADLIARSRGAENANERAFAGLNEKRAEKIQEAAKTDPAVLAAKSALAKAQKNKSPIEEEEARAQLRKAMADIEIQFPIPNMGTRGGLPTLPQGTPQPGANPSAGGSTIKYDAKGNRI